MKAVLTLIFTLLISFSAMAQAAQKEVKVETKTMAVELNITINKKEVKTTEVARVYKNKNFRVKKALHFSTKNNKAKMA